MKQICVYFLEQHQVNVTHTIVLDNKTSVRKIVQEMEQVMGIKGTYAETEEGCDVTVTPIEQSLLKKMTIPFQNKESYNMQLLAKYYGIRHIQP